MLLRGRLLGDHIARLMPATDAVLGHLHVNSSPHTLRLNIHPYCFLIAYPCTV